MIDTLSKIYQFSGKMQGTMKKTILFSVLHSLFDMMSFGALVLVDNYFKWRWKIVFLINHGRKSKTQTYNYAPDNHF